MSNAESDFSNSFNVFGFLIPYISYTLPRSIKNASKDFNVSFISISISLKSAGSKLFGEHLLQGFSFEIV